MAGTAHRFVGRRAGLIGWFGRRSASRTTALVAATAASAVVAGLLTAVPVAAAASQRTIDIDTVSVLPDGTSSSTTEISPSVSANGRYVAFIGSSTCYGGGGFYAALRTAALRSAALKSTSLKSAATTAPCYNMDAFVRDRQAGTTTLISHLPGDPTVGVGDNGYGSDVNDIAISGDGSEVAFTTDVDGVVASDTNGMNDVFVADRATAAVHPVTVPDLGAPYNGVEYQVGLSMDGNGTHLAYVVQDTNFQDHLVVEDWRAGTAVVVPLPAGTSTVDEPELSADGSRVAFVVNAGSSDSHVVVVDLADPSTPVLNRSMGEPQYYGYTGRTYGPRISLSADGRFLAYPQSASAGLAPIVVQDLSSLATPPVVLANPVTSSCDPNTQACYDMGAPALSADGNTIVFDPMSPSGTHELYKASPINATATPISVLPDGSLDTQYPGDRTPAITADGTGVVFQSNNATMTSTASGSDADYAHDPNGVAPSFAAGAALVADNLTGTQVRLTWPAATDDHVVIGYRLTRDGVTIADLDPGVTSYTVTGLTGGTTYHFAVSGVDAALNVGTPLTLAVTTSGGGSGGSTPGEAPLAVDASAGGGHATVSWDPSSDGGVTGYRVMRSTSQSGPFTQAGSDLAATATTFTDSGLDAETTYWYQVDELTAAGAQPYTEVASGTTPAISVASVAVTAPRVDGANAVPLGSDLTITVHGEANRAGTATVRYGAPDGTAGSGDAALTETAPDSGVYTGTFRIAEGMAAVTSVTATLADGAGHTGNADAPNMPLPVAGALKITVDAPAAGSVNGSKLTLLSSSLDTGAQQIVNDGETVTLPLAQSNDYELTLVEPKNYSSAPNFVVAHEQGITVTAGTTSTLEISPTMPAFLSVFVTPQVAAQVDVYGADGTLVGTKDATAAAADNAFGPLAAGSSVDVDTTVLDESAQVVKHESQTVTLAPGANVVTAIHAALPIATISGTLKQNGAPASGHVTATETVDGRPWTFATYAKSDGHYSMTVLAGDVTVTARVLDAPQDGVKTLTVASGATGTADFDLPGPHHYQLTLGIVTTEAGGGTVTLPVDWRTGVHFRVSIKGPNYYSGSWIGSTIEVSGQPGDVYTMCADGVEEGLPAACNSVTLGDSDAVSLSVALMGAGRITATLVGADGLQYTGHWNSTTYEIINGQRRQTDTALGAGSLFSVNVPESGTFEIDLTGDGGLRSRPVTVTVPQGGVVDLGDVALVPPQNAFPESRNSVVAASSETEPGQVAEFRATYYYSGSTTVPATIRLGIPAGTTLVPNSVTLNGQPVSDPTVSDGYADVALGDLAQGATGTLHYAVQTTPTTPAGPLTSLVRMSYSTSGDAFIGSATTNLVGVTLAAPSQIQGLTATVSGHAPAHAIVTVFDEFGQQVATAFATDGGLWMATATLSDRGEGYAYDLHAETTVNGLTVRSQDQVVEHDTHLVLPNSVTVSQPDGRDVTFDPKTGIARFPYVFVPDGRGLDVEACFDPTVSVSDVVARIGPSSNNVSGAGTSGNGGVGGCYTTHLNPSVSELGAIYVDYRWSPAPFSANELTPPSDPSQAREELGPKLANFAATGLTTNPDGSVTASLSDLGGYPTTVTTKVTQGAYSPTAADYAEAATTGVPLYGTTFSTSTDGADAVVTFTTHVPASWAGSTTAPQPAFLRSAGISDFLTVTTGLRVVGGGGLLFNLYGDYKNTSELNSLSDEILQGCADPQIAGDDADYLAGLILKIGALRGAGAGIAVFGLMGGWATLGVSAVLGGALGGAIGLYTYFKTKEWMQEARDKIEHDLQDPRCKSDNDQPVANPDWTIDPSGYVYEAVTSNRLADVTATLLVADSPDGPFTVWDATAYAQQNPVVSNNLGQYGWDVPPGHFWKVAYSKPGYATGYSAVFDVPPPRFDVNVGLTRLAAPTVTLTRATSGTGSAVLVGFDDFMKIDSVTSRISVVDGAGNPIAGAVQAVDAQSAPDGTMLAKTFAFVPDTPLTAGQVVTVTIDQLARDYADHTLDADVTAQLTAGTAQAPAAPTDVRAFGTDSSSVMVEWAAPTDDGGHPITGYHVSVGGQSVDVGADATSATVTGLDPMTTYQVSVAAINDVGTGAAASVTVTTPPLSPSEAFGSIDIPTFVDGGTTATGTITLGAPAADGGATITIGNDTPNLLRVPVSVAAGKTAVTFDLTAATPLTDTTVVLTLTRGVVSERIPVVVRHVPTPLSATPSLGTVTLGWTPAAGVTGYRIMRALGDGAFAQVADVDAATTTYADTGLAPGTTYRYQVFALLADGAAVPWSQIAEATTPRIPVTLTVTTSPSDPVYGQDVTIDVATTPAEAGVTVTVSEGDTVLGSAVTGDDGVAHVVVPGLSAGSHTLTVTYPGDHATLPTSTTATVTIAKAATTLTIDQVPLGHLILDLVFHRLAVRAHLTRSWDGAPVAGEQVTIDSWKGQLCVATTDADGVASCPLPAKMLGATLLGALHASFAGSANYLPSQFGTVAPPGWSHRGPDGDRGPGKGHDTQG